MALRINSKISWKMATALLAAATLFFALTNPFQKEKSAWDFYERMVMGYEMIQGVELSELERELKAEVNARNDCYEGLSNLSMRLKICRKQYLTDILVLARKNIKSSPSMGKFVLCVQECPLAYSMCRGEESNEANDGSECAVKEVQCIEACLDRYWRGTE